MGAGGSSVHARGRCFLWTNCEWGGTSGSQWENLPEIKVKTKASQPRIKKATDVHLFKQHHPVFPTDTNCAATYLCAMHKAFEQIHNPVFHYCVNLDLCSTVFNLKCFFLPKSYFPALQLLCDICVLMCKAGSEVTQGHKKTTENFKIRQQTNPNRDTVNHKKLVPKNQILFTVYERKI